MTRLFLIKNPEDCKAVNDFLENLERDDIEYEVDYDFEEGMPGILVSIEWED
ncbi:MAG: hypothetical protein NC218_09170 [Acetobacter sp.]|nr:hypothetical protein [Acetobacter sp.]